MRAALIGLALLALAGCPYRTEIYSSNAPLWKTDAAGAPVFGADGKVVFGTRMQVAKAQAEVIDLATLAAGCDTGVIASIDEVRSFGGFNIFTGSRRSLEVWCAAPPTE